MRSLLVAAALVVATPVLATPALAADVPSASSAARKPTAATTMHYPTLERMLRRFSRQAGESRTRG